ncbi:MAG: enoyl-CoA hydratase/isomerase family protein [Actinobacteria bacterium]|nr:enoyl-CoA hydratase/isomerase family protein [Actinomycetota bacterium]
MASAYETIRVERRDRVAVLWMNRPEKRNAMSPTFFRELPAVLDELDEDAGVGAVVLTGAGDAFSAGGDISGFGELTDLAAYRRQLRLVEDAFHALEQAALPVIAAVNGVAYGGGAEIVLFCDFVIASEQARFAFREIALGLQPGYGLVRGPDVIGRQWTKYLALTGDIVDARKAKEIGLVQEVVSHESLLDEALAVAGRIAANPPIAVRVGKRFVNRDTPGGGLRETMEATAILFTTEDHKEGQRAFVEKRAPRFTGR